MAVKNPELTDITQGVSLRGPSLPDAGRELGSAIAGLGQMGADILKEKQLDTFRDELTGLEEEARLKLNRPEMSGATVIEEFLGISQEAQADITDLEVLGLLEQQARAYEANRQGGISDIELEIQVERALRTAIRRNPRLEADFLAVASRAGGFGTVSKDIQAAADLQEQQAASKVAELNEIKDQAVKLGVPPQLFLQQPQQFWRIAIDFFDSNAITLATAREHQFMTQRGALTFDRAVQGWRRASPGYMAAANEGLQSDPAIGPYLTLAPDLVAAGVLQGTIQPAEVVRERLASFEASAIAEVAEVYFGKEAGFSGLLNQAEFEKAVAPLRAMYKLVAENLTDANLAQRVTNHQVMYRGVLLAEQPELQRLMIASEFLQFVPEDTLWSIYEGSELTDTMTDSIKRLIGHVSVVDRDKPEYDPTNNQWVVNPQSLLAPGILDQPEKAQNEAIILLQGMKEKISDRALNPSKDESPKEQRAHQASVIETANAFSNSVFQTYQAQRAMDPNLLRSGLEFVASGDALAAVRFMKDTMPLDVRNTLQRNMAQSLSEMWKGQMLAVNAAEPVKRLASALTPRPLEDTASSRNRFTGGPASNLAPQGSVIRQRRDEQPSRFSDFMFLQLDTDTGAISFRLRETNEITQVADRDLASSELNDLLNLKSLLNRDVAPNLSAAVKGQANWDLLTAEAGKNPDYEVAWDNLNDLLQLSTPVFKSVSE